MHDADELYLTPSDMELAPDMGLALLRVNDEATRAMLTQLRDAAIA